jgi:hypothetical protein
VSKKSTRCETAEKECRLGDGKFVAVQRYGRVCCRLKQKAVAHATALSFFYSRFKIIFLHRSIIFCGLCLYRQSEYGCKNTTVLQPYFFSPIKSSSLAKLFYCKNDQNIKKMTKIDFTNQNLGFMMYIVVMVSWF